MAFHFSLQKVLDYRAQLEEEARAAFAAAQAAEQACARHLAALQRELDLTEARLCGAVQDNGERWLLEAYARGLREDARVAAARLAELRRALEQCRAELLHRAVDKGLLDKLKERRREQFRREEALKEQKINDETATLRHSAPAL